MFEAHPSKWLWELCQKDSSCFPRDLKMFVFIQTFPNHIKRKRNKGIAQTTNISLLILWPKEPRPLPPRVAPLAPFLGVVERGTRRGVEWRGKVGARRVTLAWRRSRNQRHQAPRRFNAPESYRPLTPLDVGTSGSRSLEIMELSQNTLYLLSMFPMQKLGS